MEPISNLKKVTLFIHGVCTGDKVGPGGWASRLVCDGVVAEMFGCNPQTTANRMTLRAAIEGLQALKHRCRVNVRTDSDYVYNGMTKWLPKWKTNGWQTESGEVKNQELWKELGDAAARHVVRWTWVKVDSPDLAEHQACEALANEAANKQIASPLVRKPPQSVATDEVAIAPARTPEAVAVGQNR